MNQALLQAVVSGMAEAVAKNLLSASIAEVKLLFGFKKDLKKLKDTLIMIQNFLSDAEQKQINDDNVKLWLEQLEGVAFQSHAVLEELNYELLRQKVEYENHASKKVMSFFSPSSNVLLFQQRMAHKIRDINKSLGQIHMNAKRFGLQMATVSAGHNTGCIGLVTRPLKLSVLLEQNVVGRDADVVNVVGMIVSTPLEETVSVIPVVGLAGVGKTTLVRKVFCDDKIRAHFGKKIWVCGGASTHFDAPTLFKMILQLSTGENVQGLNIPRDVVLEKVRKHFTSEKYLLVLDNICIDEFAKWEDFIQSLSRISYFNGNCVVVTTRKANVASLIETLSTHQLGCLRDSDVWSILRSATAVQNIRKGVVEICHGLPFAAKLMGCLLNGKSENEWVIIDHQLANCGQDENAVLKMLIKFTYDQLPFASLKRCFEFCSVFPHDDVVEREQLIELWMAEGFLQADQSSDMETTGNIFFNYLLQKSLLEEVKRDSYGNVTHCRMHDVVHDIACLNINQARYLAHESVSHNEWFGSSKQQMKYLSTLFHKGKFASDMLLGFKCLHSLTLMGADIQELPKEIGKLKHLSLLDLSKTEITHLPDSVCKLYNLQTMRSKHLQKLPDSFTNLISLRHLHIPCIKLPPRVGRFSFLQTLRFYEVGHEEGCRIGELGNLENLKGKLEILNLERVRDNEEARSADLYGKPEIFKLVLAWSEVNEGDNNHEVVLEGLKPHPKLKSLKIIGYRGRKFPSWTIRMATNCAGRQEAFINLVKIKLRNCWQCGEIPMLGHLPRLKIMELSHLPNVLSLGPSFYGIDQGGNTSGAGSNVNLQGTMSPFPVLERLVLSEMLNLREWSDVEGAASTFPSLDYLEIKSCPQLKTTPNHFPRLKHLLVDDVDSDFSLTDVCCKTSSLQELRISSMPGLVSLPEEIFPKNQSLSLLSIDNCPILTRLVPGCVRGGERLQSLRISNCANLREIVDDIGTLQSLELLEIIECPELKSIPHVEGQSQGLKSLRCLKIHKCQQLSSFPFELLESSTSSLEILSLHDLENLANFSTFVPLLPRMVHLKRLEICKLAKVKNLPAETICFKGLKAFSAGGFSLSVDLSAFNDFMHCILQQSSDSLEYLHIVGQEHWDSLPDQIQHLTALRFLKLCNFRIEALPEWYGNLTCIPELCTENCQALHK